MANIDFTNLDPQAVTLAKAIRQVESNGNFNAVGDNGDSHGAYQFNKGNFAHWASQYGLDPNDFSPVNQDKVAYAKIKTWKDQGYHAGEIAAMWNGSHLENGRPIANNPQYITKVENALHSAKPAAPAQASYDPAPFGTGEGKIDLAPDPNATAPQASTLKDTAKDVAKKTGKGLLNALGQGAVGVVKGTSQFMNDPFGIQIGKGADAVSKFVTGNKGKTTGGKIIDQANTPKGNAQKVGAVIGRDVLPATGATLATAGAGSEATGIDIPQLLGKGAKAVGTVGKVIGKTAKAGAIATALAEAVSHPKKVFGLIKHLIDLIPE